MAADRAPKQLIPKLVNRRLMALLRQNPATAHPYYWAGFFLTGDPDNPNLGVGRARR